MHTLPILAEYLMSWSCSLWRFKFSLGWTGWLTVCPMAGRFKVRKYSRTCLVALQNKVQSKVEPPITAVTILVSGHIDNLIISQSFTTSPGAVFQSEIIVNFSMFWDLDTVRLDQTLYIYCWWLTSQYVRIQYQYFVLGSVFQQSHCFWTRKQQQNW